MGQSKLSVTPLASLCLGVVRGWIKVASKGKGGQIDKKGTAWTRLPADQLRDQLEREFRDENDGPMTERLLVLLPSLRSSANSSANNEGLVEDLLFRVGLERVSSRLLTMRKLFPTCDVAEMATKNPKVYLKFSSDDDGDTNGDDERDEREWQLEIEKLERMFPFAGQNGLPNVQRMVICMLHLL